MQRYGISGILSWMISRNCTEYEEEQEKQMSTVEKEAHRERLRSNPFYRNSQTPGKLATVMLNFLNELVLEIGRSDKSGGRELDDLRSPVIIWDSLHTFPPPWVRMEFESRRIRPCPLSRMYKKEG